MIIANHGRGGRTMKRALGLVLAGTAISAVGSAAGAATFVFSSGSYVPGTTAPEPLLAPDILRITGGSNKFFNAVTMTNQSGTVNWEQGALFLQSGAIIDNRSLWDALGDDSINYNGGAAVSFLNSGIFRKSGGAGTTTVNGVNFTNSGTIDAQTGTINFTGGGAVFNAGSAFTGAGIVAISSASAFNGAFTTENLRFASGTYTGSDAVMSGDAEWVAGRFTGGWTIADDSALTLRGGSNRFLDGATMVNDGVITWAEGSALFLESGTTLTNNDTIAVDANGSINYNGGPATLVTNAATGQISVAGGVTFNIANAFRNDGGALNADGTMSFTSNNATFNDGTSFNGGGAINVASSAQFNGGFTSENLRLSSGTYTGGDASFGGDVAWISGTFAGDWTIDADGALALVGGSNRFMSATSFVNDGTFEWAESSGLFLQSGATLTNNNRIDVGANAGITYNGGAATLVVNSASGTITTDEGVSLTIANAFRNDGGTITSNGTISFSSNNAMFNDGTVFDGAGFNRVNSDAAFNGAFASTNLALSGGTYTGTDAGLSGDASWSSGSFSGSWTIAADGKLTALGGANRFLTAADMTNLGTMTWQDSSALFLQSGAVLSNEGLMDLRTDVSFNYNGGTAVTFANEGTILKTGAGTTATIGNNVGFTNRGTIDVESGTVRLPSNFVNDGTLTGGGAFSLSGTLTNNGVVDPGNGAGTVDLTGNYLQTAIGGFNVDIASSTLADLFQISGTASLDGSLVLTCFAGCAIDDGDIFTILDSTGALTGSFASVTATGFLDGFDYDVIYDYAGSRVQLLINDAGTPVVQPPVVPEPQSWAMMLAGFGAVGYALRRRPARRTQAV